MPRHFGLGFGWMVTLCVAAPLRAAEAPASSMAGDAYAAPGKCTVKTITSDWRDTARDLTVPVKIYYPTDPLPAGHSGWPVIVFSHGLGGSRDGYEIWSRQWASHGYVVINPTHVGSDSSVLMGGMEKVVAAANLEQALRRTADVKFVLDELEKVNAGTSADKGVAGLKGLLDLKHIGMAGHSFGAVTTMMIAGQSGEVLGKERTEGDKRVTAAIAMSPQPATRQDQDAAFGVISMPVMMITGTQDDSPIGDLKAPERRIPFDHMKSAGTMLITFEGAVHMSFAPAADGLVLGQRLRLHPVDESAIQKDVKAGTTAFWDAHLKGDTAAAEWLAKEYTGFVGAAGKVEEKPQH